MQKRKSLGLLLLVITILSVIPLINAGNQVLSFSSTFGGAFIDRAYSLAWKFGTPSGKLYVVGSSISFSGLHSEGYVAMFDENLGSPIAVKKTNFAASNELLDVAVTRGIATDYIAVVGFSPNDNRDPIVYWLNPDLSSINQFELVVFSGTQRDEAVAVGIDNQGNTVITGFTLSGDSPFDNFIPFLVKFNPSGAILWSVAFRPTITGSQPSYPGDLAIISWNNHIIVVGSVTIGPSYDAFVARFDPAGNIIWYRTFGDSKREHAYGVAYDNQGNIYVAGATNSFSPTGTYDTFVAKFAPDGTLLWFKLYDIGALNANDWAISIAIIEYDHIYITGETRAFDADGDMFFAKIKENGDLVYAVRSNMPGKDIGYDIALNIHSQNDVFYINIAGVSNDNPTSDSFESVSVTTSTPPITPQPRDLNIANPAVLSTTPTSPLVDGSFDTPSGERAMVLKFDPPSVPNENKNSNIYISHFLIATIIALIAATAIFIKRRNK